MLKLTIEQVKQIPISSLMRMIDKAKSYIKNDDVMKGVCKEYNINVDIVDYIPTKFGELDVSARTDHGVVTLSYKLLCDGDFFKDYSYLIHEYTHVLQQCFGEKPTKSADAGYLDNPHEQEAFQNQIEYIADELGNHEADKYVDRLLDHHDINDQEERKEKEEVLLSKV